MNKMSPQRARERALFLYRSALERGDFDIVIAVLKIAERDPILEQMIDEMAQLDEIPSRRPEGSQSLFYRSKGITQFVVRRDPSPDGWPQLANDSEEENDVNTSIIPARTLPGTRKWDPITLIAAVVAIVLLGALLLFLRSVFNLAGGSESIQPMFAAQQEECSAGSDFVLLGQTALDGGNYEEAIKQFTCAINADPKNYEAYIGRGSAYALTGEYFLGLLNYYQIPAEGAQMADEALARYTKAIEANPDDLAAYTLRSFMYWAEGNPDNLMDADCTRILELDPENAYGHLCLGFVNVGLGNLQQASDDFSHALELKPDNPALYAMMAVAYIPAEEPDLILEYANRAVELAPEQALYYILRAAAYKQAGESALAASDVARYIELAQTERIAQNVALDQSIDLPMITGRVYSIPFSAEAGQRLSITMTRGSASSIPVWVLLAEDGTPLISEVPDDPSFPTGVSNYTVTVDGTFTLLATTVLRAVEVENTITISLTERCDPDLRWLRFGNSSLEDGDYQQAIVEFTCALENDPNNNIAYLGRSSAYVLTGDLLHSFTDMFIVQTRERRLLDDAIADYTGAILTDPNDLTAYTLRGWVWMYGYLPWLGNWDKQLENCNHILELDPDNAFGHYACGIANWYGGDRQLAQEHYARVLELAPDNPNFYAFIANDISQAFPEQALEYANRAIELAPEDGVYYLFRARVAGESAPIAADLVRYIELKYAETVPQSIELTQPVALPMTAEKAYSIQFEAHAGQRVNIQASHNPSVVWPILVLLGEDGTPLTGETPLEEIARVSDYTIPADGTYTILLGTDTPEIEGEMTVTVTLED